MLTTMTLSIAALLAGAGVACGQVTLAEWTFETSVPTTAGPHAAEGGTLGGNAFAVTGGTISNPTGNGTPESMSSNGWDAGDYFEFRTSSTGYAGLTFSWSQGRSPTGPELFDFTVSTDGASFVTLLPGYSVRVLSGPGWSSPGVPVAMDIFTVNLPAAYDNQALLVFRMVSLQTVAAAGTNRVDSVTLTVPAPAAGSVFVLGALAAGAGRRRRTT